MNESPIEYYLKHTKPPTTQNRQLLMAYQLEGFALITMFQEADEGGRRPFAVLVVSAVGAKNFCKRFKRRKQAENCFNTKVRLLSQAHAALILTEPAML